jgi:hypothetical protein
VSERLSRPGFRVKLHFPAGPLPASESDQAVLVRRAQERDTQQLLRNMRAIRRSHFGFPSLSGSPERGRIPRFGYRQLSYHFTQGFSAPEGNGIYYSLGEYYVNGACVAKDLISGKRSDTSIGCPHVGYEAVHPIAIRMEERFGS